MGSIKCQTKSSQETLVHITLLLAYTMDNNKMPF